MPPLDCSEVTRCLCVQVKSSNAWDALKPYVPFATAALSAFTFWLGYRQKEHDRTSGYYQKVVVDVVLPELIGFNEKYIPELDQLAASVGQRPKEKRKTTPRDVTLELRKFSEDLFELQDKITDRTTLFDLKTSARIEQKFDAFQDAITGWFNDASVGKRRERSDLRSLVQEFRRELVRELYKGKVRSF